MTFYPFPNTLQKAWQQRPSGNFGLWYNKYVPLSDDQKLNASDDRGDKTKPVEHYEQIYKKMIQNKQLQIFLDAKHDALDTFIAGYLGGEYERIFMAARLTAPLITGIGESHPHEVSMVFDHNLGIPYIPASGIKGIVRFAHTLSIWENGLPEEFPAGLLERDRDTQKITGFDDENYEPVYSLFGNQKNRGKVIFLDAYPAVVPALHIDIMNPHYGDYYADDMNRIPPADYLSPNPIKFLTVAPGTVFIFRALAKRKDDMPVKVRAAFVKALTVEGVGAKTAVGYGRFTLDEKATEDRLKKLERKKQEEALRRFPWRGHLERLTEINDWGGFKTHVLENATLTLHKHEKEVAAAVKAKAIEIREQWKKNWEPARDEQIAAWLVPAGEQWDVAVVVSTDTHMAEQTSDAYKAIENMRDWGAFKSAGIEMDGLDVEALRLLLKKMEKWGCNDKKAKDDKRHAYKMVKEYLKKGV
ncbi:MAG TPA: type III-B CRISPR module RAMP protein Cmr6 [Syntrophales bacterium]|nr:type III-B CRISPR module RAMP protein Cmr6 [Syntrophales bacterium]HPC33696.1 type III-B CRISPR module RAMP protein Cmr6 [Syntrophales bacterium]HQG34143.1 type III-B CRISPR module RAMP protein Cmr6 [Syntrophales bacterium]